MVVDTPVTELFVSFAIVAMNAGVSVLHIYPFVSNMVPPAICTPENGLTVPTPTFPSFVIRILSVPLIENGI
jgi:hypothetical protein